MKNPETYTEQELSQKYKMLKFADGSEVGLLCDHDGLEWGVPASFSLGDARDILEWPAARLEKLRTVKPGCCRKISANPEEPWGVVRDSEIKPLRVRNLERHVEGLNQKIDHRELSPMPLIVQRNRMIRQIQALQSRQL